MSDSDLATLEAAFSILTYDDFFYVPFNEARDFLTICGYAVEREGNPYAVGDGRTIQRYSVLRPNEKLCDSGEEASVKGRAWQVATTYIGKHGNNLITEVKRRRETPEFIVRLEETYDAATLQRLMDMVQRALDTGGICAVRELAATSEIAFEIIEVAEKPTSSEKL